MNRTNYLMCGLLAMSMCISCITYSKTHTHPEFPHATEQAVVRTNNALCAEEQTFVTQRHRAIKSVLEKFIGNPIADGAIPTIAVCCSGGGYRAMLATLGSINISMRQSLPYRKRGFLSTLAHHLINIIGIHSSYVPDTQTSTHQSLGLLDICTYAAALSGSTWALAGLVEAETSVDDYIDHLSHTLSSPLISNVSHESLVQMILHKCSHKQDVSLIDVYGGLLSQKLLYNPLVEDKNGIYLTAQQENMDNNVPLPIYTAVTGTNPDYQWIEFTPFEIGSATFSAYIPTWAFGRSFEDGLSQNFNPPQTLGFGLGIWGSAMSINMQEFYDDVLRPYIGKFLTPESKTVTTNLAMSLCNRVYSTQKNLIDGIIEYRLSAATVPNWTLGMPQTSSSTLKTLTLVDAGIDFNIPIVPLLNRPRSPDIIIILDASSGPLGCELIKAEEYAQKHGLKMPPINQKSLNQTCSVHQSSQEGVPTILYMPLIKHDDYCNGWDPFKASFTNTFNFTYTPAEINLLCGLATHNMITSLDIIANTIRECIAKKGESL